jgi:hypothetical protein
MAEKEKKLNYDVGSIQALEGIEHVNALACMWAVRTLRLCII